MPENVEKTAAEETQAPAQPQQQQQMVQVEVDDTHVAAAHTRQYRDEVQPMTGSPLDERTYKTIE